MIYSDKGDWEEALLYYSKSEKICLKVGNKAGLAFIYFNIGGTYYQKKEIQEAAELILMGYLLASELGMMGAVRQFEEIVVSRMRQEMGENKFIAVCDIAKQRLTEKLK